MKNTERAQLVGTKMLLIGLGVVGVLAVLWFAWGGSDKKTDSPAKSIDSFQACKDAGRPILESYPEVCIGPDGTRYSNPTQ